MTWYQIAYMVVGFLTGVFMIVCTSQAGQKTKVWELLLGVSLWPIFWFLIIMQLEV